MSQLSTVEARKQFSTIVNQAAFGGERIVVTRRGRPLAAIVPLEDLEAMEALEDAMDNAEADRRLNEATEEDYLDWEEAKKSLSTG